MARRRFDYYKWQVETGLLSFSEVHSLFVTRIYNLELAGRDASIWRNYLKQLLENFEE